jgi:hypothetical protein
MIWSPMLYSALTTKLIFLFSCQTWGLVLTAWPGIPYYEDAARDAASIPMEATCASEYCPDLRDSGDAALS